MSLANAAWIWVPLLAIATIAARSGMNDIASSRASIADQLPCLTTPASLAAEPALPCHLRFVYRFFCGFCHAGKNPVPGCEYSAPGVFGPFIGAIARSVGGAISDKFGGVRVTLINFIFMAIFSALLFLTLPGTGSGNFIAFTPYLWGCF